MKLPNKTVIKLLEPTYYLTLDLILRNTRLFSSRSMSDEEQESGCDTVDGSPTSDSSGRDSPFAENSFVEATHQSTELVTSANTEAKPAVCTVVVPPMGLESGLNADEHMANTGKPSPYFSDYPFKGLNLGTSEISIA